MGLLQEKKMKIVHCLSHFLPKQTAGTEVYTWALCKSLHNRGIDSEILIPNYNELNNSFYEYDSIKVNKYAEPSIGDKKLTMGLRPPDGLGKFKELLQSINPDIVNFHELAGSSGIGIYHIEIAASLGYKCVMTFHLANYSCKAQSLMYKGLTLCDGIINENKCTSCMLALNSPPAVASSISFLSKIVYNLGINVMGVRSKLMTGISYPFNIHKLKKDLELITKKCNKIVVISRWYESILKKNNVSADKIIYIPQGLVPQNVGSKKEQENNRSGVRKFIFLGRISKYKGLHLLLDSLEILNKPNIKIDVYGFDPDDNYARICKERIGNMSNIEFLGRVSPELVVTTMKNYDALILPSTFSEMSPLVIQEAFAAKIPVIASDVYGNAEQISNGKNGWLFKYNDCHDLARVLTDLLKKPSLFQQAKKNIPEVLNFEKISDEYIKLYQTILSE